MFESLQRIGCDVTRVIDVNSVGGGCISEASHVVIETGRGEQRDLFVKRNNESFLENFRCEWEGLEQIAASGVIAVPRPIAVGTDDGAAWLVTEWISVGQPGTEFYDVFGKQLAELHRQTLGQRIGWDRDNFLGAAPQRNPPGDNWAAFFAEHRIEFQIRWAVDQALADYQLVTACNVIAGSLNQLLAGRDDTTSLLHGDLWSGNYLCDRGGRPVLIDPAVSYGCREAEFGMLQLFGGCRPSFYQAYQEAFAMPDGWQRRVKVYVLYHLLNHLNLFGSSYHGQCLAMASEILREN